MAKININQKIIDLKDGKELKVKDTPESPEYVMTLKKVIINSVLAFYPKEQESGQDKYNKFLIVKKISWNDERKKNGLIDFTVKELKIIKDAIGKLYSPLIVGQAWDMLKQKDKKEK